MTEGNPGQPRPKEVPVGFSEGVLVVNLSLRGMKQSILCCHSCSHPLIDGKVEIYYFGTLSIRMGFPVIKVERIELPL